VTGGAGSEGRRLTFAVADLHGRYDLLLGALARIEARAEAGTVVFLGDYVDRGPQSCQVVETLMAGPPAPAWRWVCLEGNHDAMMAGVGRGTHPLEHWLDNGGGATLISYGQSLGEFADPGVIPESHLAWLEALPLLHVDAHRVYVHAAVDPLRPLDDQDPEILLWHRYPPEDTRGHGGRHVVHGHHPFADGPHTFGDRTDLDTLAWNTSRLVVGVFDDALAGGPIEFLEVLAPPPTAASRD
jgi:serine/threonine protein phosphatase 1